MTEQCPPPGVATHLLGCSFHLPAFNNKPHAGASFPSSCPFLGSGISSIKNCPLSVDCLCSVTFGNSSREFFLTVCLFVCFGVFFPAQSPYVLAKKTYSPFPGQGPPFLSLCYFSRLAMLSLSLCLVPKPHLLRSTHSQRPCVPRLGSWGNWEEGVQGRGRPGEKGLWFKVRGL